MMHAPPHKLFDILPRVSTLNIIQRKLEKPIIPDIFTSFCMYISQRLEVIDKPKLTILKTS